MNPSHVSQPSSPDLNKIIVDPTETKIATPSRTDDKPWLSRRGQRIDFAEKDAANRKLGKLAEEDEVMEIVREYGSEDNARHHLRTMVYDDD